jgi:hypothetical protein
VNDDFESRFARLLNEQVDAGLGPRRAAPPFDPGHSIKMPAGARRRSARPWIVPLVAAAAVVVVAAGTLGVSRLVADKHNSPATTPTPPAPTQSPTATPTPTPTPMPSTPVPDKSGTVNLAGATLTLPSGWVARDFLRYDPDESSDPTRGWCLTPASTQAKVGGCPISFRLVVPLAAPEPMIDVDNRGGFYGNPHQVCVPSGVTHSATQAAERTFGGRAAEWRQWRDDCASGPPFLAEQYVVPTAPAYVIFSEQVDPTVHRLMTNLAADASLPPATPTMRYEDFGYVRRITVVADGIRVSIDRTVRDQAADADHTTYDYVVPNKVYARSATPAHLKVGQLAQVFTDGTRVISIYRAGQ